MRADSRPPHDPDAPLVVWLSDPSARDARLTGTKAATLARLRQAGHRVPDGFVVTTAGMAAIGGPTGRVEPPEGRAAGWPEPLRREIRDALGTLGGKVAVRSSAVAEDLPGASFAGQFETILDVGSAIALERALARCLASADTDRVRAYRLEHATTEGSATAAMAVLVQRMVPARAAGVAFTAHPITGERDVVLVGAVGGVGEPLASGLVDGEEWEVRDGRPRRTRARSEVLTEVDALRVAELARVVAGGDPLDVEWALEGDEPVLLQARPMTALPDPVSWEAPLPGNWIRYFRLGEWIGAPLTPLAESWLVSDLEEGMHRQLEDLFGIRSPRPLHVVVNGWYYYGLNADLSLGSWLRALPTMLRNFRAHYHQMMAVNPPTAHLGFSREAERWRSQLLPRFRALVSGLEDEVEAADPAVLPALVQKAIDASAEQLASIIGVSGYAAKVELRLLALWREHLSGVEGSVFDLVAGAGVQPAAHDVEGLDWYFPTLGERGPLPPPPTEEARERVRARREETAARARAALPRRHRGRFDALLDEARRAHEARQAQTGMLTLAWPMMRRALRRLGSCLVGRGVIVQEDDIFFLQRAELHAALHAAPRATAAHGPPSLVDVRPRRATWQRQRRLAAPLELAELQGFHKRGFDIARRLLHYEEHDAADALPGMPGSPGRVTGPARVILGVDELAHLRPGEILVAPVTTPGWTPAFARAVAIVTDSGSVTSHASIVAREHGIPAVVGTGCATTRIVDGQRITVDGGRGVVRLGG